jgi:peptide/nickel transport system substrate-binding protein
VPAQPLRIGVEDTLTCLWPGKFASMSDAQVGLQLYQTLVAFDGDLKVTGRLAETWECSKDGRTYVLRLRAPLFFHDGSPVDALHVRNYLDTVLLERLGVRRFTESVELGRDREVVLRLTRSFSPLLARLASPSAVIPSAHPEPPMGLPGGTGPFRRPRVVASTVRVDACTDAGPFAGVTFLPYRSGVEMWQALLAGEVDVIYECPYRVLTGAVERQGTTVKSCPALGVNMLTFNLRSPVVASPQSRRSVAAAIDKHALLREVNLGVGTAAGGPLAPASPFFHPPAADDDETGRDDAAPPRHLTVLATRGFTPRWIELFTAQLERRGIRCDVRLLPVRELRRALADRDFDAALLGAPAGGDPDQVFYEWFHSEGRNNHSGLSDPAYDDLVTRARFSQSFPERVELYARATRLLRQLVPAVFLRHGLAIVAHGSTLTGLEPNPLGYLDLSRAAWSSPPAGS